MSSVLIAMFDSEADASRARSDLLAAGFADSALHLTGGTAASGTMAGGTTTTTTTPTTTRTHAPEKEGAIARFFDNLFGDDDDHDERTRTGYTETYREAFNRGSYGLSVTTVDEDETDKAERILNSAGAIDIDERAESWRSEGWSGGGMGAMTTAAGGSELDVGGTRKLQEVEEELVVGKRAVARGGVRIFSRLKETPVSETVRLREEHASVQRRAVDRPATEADFASFKEGTVEVRESAEEAVVTKTSRVTGEVEISKTSTEHEETVEDTVRKTEVEVEKIDPMIERKRPL